MAQAKAAASILFKIIDRDTAIDADAPGIAAPPGGGGALKGDIHFAGPSIR